MSGYRGPLPAHWRLRRLMHLTPDTRQIMYGIVLPGPNVEEGVPIVKSGDCRKERLRLETLHRTTQEIEAPFARARLEPGDLVYAIRGSIGLVAIAPPELRGANLTQDAARIAPRVGIHPPWLFYAVQSHSTWAQLEPGIVGATVKGINIRDLKRPWIPVPPADEQRAIAEFLDEKTAIVDALIDKKERLVALLDEKRLALTTQAVTKGLDPSVPMKNSGIEWLGAVPAHWRVERTKALFSERRGRSETGDEEMLTVSHITGVTPRSEKTVYMTEAETTEGYKLVAKNDLAVNTMWAWMGALGVSPCDGIVSPAYNVYAPRDAGGVWFYDLLVRTPAFVAEINRWSKGIWSSRLRLYPTEFFQLMLPVPPSAERERIVAHVAAATTADRKLAETAQRSIVLLREYREAVITAAVTGQLDVRSKQARAMEPAA